MSQLQWVQAQLLLDAGASLCTTCDSVEPGRWCRLCGADKSPVALARCDSCQVLGEGPYCVQCGGMLGDVLQRQIDAGTFDVHAWRESMQPFLQDFTEAEKAALRREGLPIPGEASYGD